MRQAISGFAVRSASYFWSKADRAIDRFTRELGEHRTWLAWAYSAAFLALVFYTATTNKNSHNTSIMTLGSIVAAVFSTYVLSGSYERVSKMRMNVPTGTPKTQEGEEGGSD